MASGVSSMMRSTPVSVSMARMLRPFHLVVRQRHHADGGLRHMIRGAALDRHGDDLPGRFFGLVARLLLKFHELHSLVVGQLVFEVLEQVFLGLVRRVAGNALEHFELALLHGLGLGQPLLRLPDLPIQGILLAVQAFELLVEVFLFLLHAALLALDLLAAVVDLFLVLAAQAVELILALQHNFLLLRFRRFDGVAHNPLGLLLCGANGKFGRLFPVNAAEHEAHGSGNGRAHNGNHDGYCNRHQTVWTPPCVLRRRRTFPSRDVSQTGCKIFCCSLQKKVILPRITGPAERRSLPRCALSFSSSTKKIPAPFPHAKRHGMAWIENVNGIVVKNQFRPGASRPARRDARRRPFSFLF